MDSIASLYMWGFYMLIPMGLLYLVVKVAIKHAIVELKRENVL